MAENMSTGKAMRRAHRLSVIFMVFFFSLAEVIALSNFWGRREMHMDIYSVCFMPMLVALPFITAILVSRRIRGALENLRLNPDLIVNINYRLTSLTGVFYAVLSTAMSLLLNAVMHLRPH